MNRLKIRRQRRHRTRGVNAILFALIMTATFAFIGMSPSAADDQDIVFSLDFDESESDSPALLFSDPSSVRIVENGFQGSRSLRVESPASSGLNSANASIAIPIESLRGRRLRIEATVKAEGVSRPPNPWNGIEVMLHFTTPNDERWVQPNDIYGTFDWGQIQCMVRVPDDAIEARLSLGLEMTEGVALFDDVRIVAAGRKRSVEGETSEDRGPVFRGHDLERLRGAMIGPHVDAEDLRVLGGEWNANHVRWQFIWGGFPHGPGDTAEPDEYLDWIDGQMERLDSLLPVCRENGIMVVIDIHTPPGGRDETKVCRVFHEKKFQDAFLEAWERIARRYRDEPNVWAYDLMNEPVEGVVPAGVMNWHELATEAARRIRAIDPTRAIIVEPAPWGSPESLDFFEPIDVENVVYSVHMYKPHEFTHQGVHDDVTGIAYPGEINGRYYDKDALREALRPAIEYASDYNVHMYIGEFSAIRWAPGTSARDYLRDVIDICEENEWDWAYHAYREWDGWSVEHGSDREDRTRQTEPNERMRLLLEAFEANEKP